MMPDPTPSPGSEVPSICEDGQTITLQSLYQTSPTAARYARSGTLDFKSSPVPSCAVCSFLISVAKEAQEHKMRSGINDYRFQGIWPLGPQQIGLAWSNMDGYEKKYDIVHICKLDDKTRDDDEVKIIGGFDLVADLGSYAANFIHQRRIGGPASDTTFAIIRQWLKICEESHEECRSQFKLIQNVGNFPARIIDVGSESDSLCLVQVGEHLGRYATLSHCWGGKTNIMTTKSNINAHMTAIEYSKLSKTFQDSITITRRLGIQYLWIDSLCIIQDDADDWRAQADVMGLIYERSFCTIAATCSPDGSVGCWPPRGSNPVVRLPCDPLKPENGFMYFIADPEYHNPLYHWEKSVLRRKGLTRYPKSTGNIEVSELNDRGWVLQERILSRRILHFADDQVYWECNRSFIGEDNIPRKTDIQFRVPRNLSTLEGRAWADSYGLALDTPFWHFRRWWFDMISFFTVCSLTCASDRLPALAGLAGCLASETGYEYHDGVFFFAGEARLRNLLWFTVGRNPTKPVPIRASSWSWASLEGPVDFMDSKRNMTDFSDDNQISNPDKKLAAALESIDYSSRDGLANYCTLRLSGIIKAIPLSDLFSFEREDSLARFSMNLLGAHSRISRSVCSWPRTPDREIRVQKSYKGQISQRSGVEDPARVSEDSKALETLGWICFDMVEDIPSSIFCTPLWVPTRMRMPGRPSIAMVLILIKEAEVCNPAKYRRVGIGEVQDMQWFKDSAREDFILV